jgi:hypothetical protein
MSAPTEATVKNFRERLELYSSKCDAMDKYFEKYAYDYDEIINCRKWIHDIFDMIKSNLNSRDENELLQGVLLDIFEILWEFDIDPSFDNLLKLYQAIDKFKNRDILIYISIRKYNENEKIDLTWIFTKKDSKPKFMTETPGAELRYFFTNLNEKIMVYNGIKFIPDQDARPLRGSDGEFYLELYGEKFPCFSNIDISKNSIENPVIISIEPRRNIFHI